MDGISAATGVERGILELTVAVASNLRNGAVDDTDNDYVEITVSLDSDAKNIMEAILDNAGGTEFGNQTVEYVSLEDTEYAFTVATTTDQPHTTGDAYEEDGDDDEGGSDGGWIATIVVLMLLVIILVVVLYRKMYVSEAKKTANENTLGIEMNASEAGGATLMKKETADENQEVENESDSESLITDGKPTKR